MVSAADFSSEDALPEAATVSSAATSASEAGFEASKSSKVSSHWSMAAFTVSSVLVSRYASTRAFSAARCCWTERTMPRENSALFSKSEFVQAGPWPSRLTVYGMPGMAEPQAWEQPVAFAQ